jgi:hypothetical protein
MHANESAQPRARHVIGPDGRRLTLADLPLPDTKRWVIRRKAEVVAAVRGGLLSLEEACSHYALNVDEFNSWQRCIDRFGLAGLRTTRTQHYPRTVARPESCQEFRLMAMLLQDSDQRSEAAVCANASFLEEATMLDGRRYFAAFPDEDPTVRSNLQRNPKLLATLAVIEKEIRSYIQYRLKAGVEEKK